MSSQQTYLHVLWKASDYGLAYNDRVDCQTETGIAVREILKAWMETRRPDLVWTVYEYLTDVHVQVNAHDGKQWTREIPIRPSEPVTRALKIDVEAWLNEQIIEPGRS